MEKYKKGGYTILDLESSTIYADSVKALDSNKPIVVYDGTNKPYFADTISLSGTNVVITKGGKTITIANDNTITSKGSSHLYKYTLDCEFTTDEDSYDNRFFIIHYSSNKYDNTSEGIKKVIEEIHSQDYTTMNGLINFDGTPVSTAILSSIIVENDKVNVDIYALSQSDTSYQFDFDAISFNIKQIY